MIELTDVACRGRQTHLPSILEGGEGEKGEKNEEKKQNNIYITCFLNKHYCSVLNWDSSRNVRASLV